MTATSAFSNHIFWAPACLHEHHDQCPRQCEFCPALCLCACHQGDTVTAPQQHPAVAAVMQYFTFKHLPAHLKAVSRPIAELAQKMADTLPDNPAKTDGLKKLLEAKDYLVRAALAEDDHGRRPVE